MIGSMAIPFQAVMIPFAKVAKAMHHDEQHLGLGGLLLGIQLANQYFPRLWCYQIRASGN